MRNKVGLYKFLVKVSAGLFVIAGFATFRSLYFLILDALFLACMIVFAVLSAKAVGAAGINAVKEALANRAFDKLLTPGTDYTVMAQVAGAVLVKKVVKWAYCYVKGGSVINALFIITTDINTFAFQAQGEKLFRIDDAELPMSMYEFK